MGASPIVKAAGARHAGRMRPRVLLVDDQEGFRAVARDLLTHGDFDVVGEARRLAKRCAPSASFTQTWCCSTSGCRTVPAWTWPRR